ncbi:MAG: DUF1684 domain-containing protein, partial [Actinomycetota bacterium]
PDKGEVDGSNPSGPTVTNELELLDWKRRAFELYAAVRAQPDGARAWSIWREQRDDLFAHHPQSPIPENERAGFTGLEYFDYDPDLHVIADVRAAETEHFEIPTSGDDTMGFTRVGLAAFELAGQYLSLEVYWLDGYGGGLFVPFADATSGDETYGAGRYLLDTIKGSDLGSEGDDRLILDFNFAYNPSCSYDPRWVCPLAPPANRLEVRVRAGEKHTEKPT